MLKGSHMSNQSLPSHASVVVLGGGIMGCSTLYHLAELGVGGAPVRGDFLAFKLGREMWSHLPPDMPGTAGRVCMWPKGRTYSGSSGFGRLYFGAKNLLVNTEFTGVPNKQGFYPSWHGKPGTHGFTP